MLLFNICTLPWWIPWFFLPLLGLLAGWLLWGKFKGMVADLEADISRLNSKISGLEADLDTCNKKRAELNSALTLCEGRLKEANAGPANIKATNSSTPPVSNEPVEFASSGSASKRNIYSVLTSDNLQVIEGIGPKMDEVMKKHGVHSWKKLSENTHDSLRAILDKENPKRYRIIDPATWPDQAKLANDGKWGDLIKMQKELDTGHTHVGDGETDSKVEKILIKLGVLKRWQQDDLKAIEGIGPKIEGLLKADGIDTWRKVANSSVDTIQAILDKAGKRYKLSDPGTWPKQAEMAADGRWDDLQEYQDFLQGGK